MDQENFSDIGRVKAIERLYSGTGYCPFQECSFRTGNKYCITSATKLFSEGIDFSLIYFPLKHLGYKCTTAVVGELYASLSKPLVLDVRLGISSKLDYIHIKELWSGIVLCAKEHGIQTISLDLLPSANGLSIALSATGEKNYPVDVNTPAPASKDLICVSGSLGGAYLGMRLLEAEKISFEKEGVQPDLISYKMIVGDYLKPTIDSAILSHMDDCGIIPCCGYLITRGLSDAVKRLCRDTGLGAKIYAEMIPFEGNSFELGKKLGIDTVSAALNGGDDYKLLYVIPIKQAEMFRRDFQTFDIVGHMAQKDVGGVIVTPDGVELPLRAQGWK